LLKTRKFKKRFPSSTNELKRLIERWFEANINTIAPYTLLFLSTSVLLFLSLMSRSEKTFIENMNLDIIRSKPTPINIPKANTLYIFEIEQAFSSQVLSYSELEIELLDKN